jgi:Peptidase family S41
VGRHHGRHAELLPLIRNGNTTIAPLFAAIRRRPVRATLGLVALALAQHPATAAASEVGAAILGVDPSFAPMFGRRPWGTVLQRVPHPTSDQIRWADTTPSVAGTADLGAGRLLVRLDRFGRKIDQEISAALRLADAELVLDLRHNRGGVLRRMLRAAARFTGPVPGAVRLVEADRVRVLAIPEPSGAVWRGRITVLVGADTMSSGEVLAALLRRHAGARVLGERTWGKDYVLRVEPIDHDWRALIPAGRIEVPGEVLAGGLVPDGPITEDLSASLPTN